MPEEAINLIAARSKGLSEKRLSKVFEKTDEELVSFVLAGEEKAFAEIFERHRRLAAHLIGRFFSRREEIEDLIQQAFTKAYFSLESYRGGNENSFPAWLSRLTINLCYDELRRQKRKPESLFGDFSEEEGSYLESMAEDKRQTAEEALIARDLSEKVLSRLGAKERIAFTLVYGEEMSVSETAKLLGWSESNVKIRLYRGRKTLKKIFGSLFN